MQIFRCPACTTRVYFDNITCGCGAEMFFDAEAQAMLAQATPCANRAEIGCNWISAGAEDGLCRSCAMTETVPDLRSADNLPLWARTEAAKRWMLANLGRWGWFTDRDAGARPVFRLLSEDTDASAAPIVMGHADGIITINVTEADDAVRVARKADLGELYRTMLGHMRHEMAHFLHVRLVETAVFADAFRALFGDERADYGAALERHYAAPRAPGDTHITAYATAHPHEDWAETVAHLLHLIDIADSAAAAGLRLGDGTGVGLEPYAEEDTERVLTRAVSLSLAITHVTRALDQPDLYPFVLTPKVREKLGFAHGALRCPPQVTAGQGVTASRR